jgi:hypothetical protein
MNRYKNVVIPRNKPFITGDAADLIRQLVVLREQFARAGMWQTYHALDAAQLKAGFEYADHIGLTRKEP